MDNAEKKSRTAELARLRALLERVDRRDREAAPAGAALSDFERLLGGVSPRRLVDCLAGAAGSGAGLVALWLCQRACRRRGELVVVDPEGRFYPPAAAAWGVDARRLLVVRPAGSKDALAAVGQALRSPAVGAVWASLGRVDDRAFRRLLLAAEAGEAFGALVRSARHEADPSWADVQLRFEPEPSAGDPDASLRVRVARVRNRHGPAGGAAALAIDWRTGRIEETTCDDQRANEGAAARALRVGAGLAGAAASA